MGWREMKEKFELYQYAGVIEYWLVNPQDEFIIIYTLNTKGKYVGSKPYTDKDIIESEALKGFKLDLSEIF